MKKNIKNKKNKHDKQPLLSQNKGYKLDKNSESYYKAKKIDMKYKKLRYVDDLYV